MIKELVLPYIGVTSEAYRFLFGIIRSHWPNAVGHSVSDSTGVSLHRGSEALFTGVQKFRVFPEQDWLELSPDIRSEPVTVMDPTIPTEPESEAELRTQRRIERIMTGEQIPALGIPRALTRRERYQKLLDAGALLPPVVSTTPYWIAVSSKGVTPSQLVLRSHGEEAFQELVRIAEHPVWANQAVFIAPVPEKP